MIKSDYYLVKNSIENKDDILSIVDINGNLNIVVAPLEEGVAEQIDL